MGGPGGGGGGGPLPPPPPGPGGPPGGPDDGGDDVGQKLDQVLQKLTDIEDKDEEINNVLEEHEKAIHEQRMQDASPEEVDRDVREKKNKLKDDDRMSAEEFGVQDLGLFMGRRDGRRDPMSALRNARNERVAQMLDARTAQSDAGGQYIPDKPDLNLEQDHWGEEEQRKPVAPTFDVPWGEIFQPASAEEQKTREEKQNGPQWYQDSLHTKSAGALNLAADRVSIQGREPFWVVVNASSDRPLARIERPNSVTLERFAHDDYGAAVITAIHEVGPAETMKRLCAYPITPEEATALATMQRNADMPEFLKDKEKDDKDKDGEGCGKEAAVSFGARDPRIVAAVKQQFGDHLNAFKRSFGLAWKAAEKNYIDNHLKAALHQVLQPILRGGDPSDVIESAFAMAGEDLFHTLVAQAEEWMQYDPAAFAQVEDWVTNSNPAPVESFSPGMGAGMGAEARSMQRRAAVGSLVPTSEGAGIAVHNTMEAQIGRLMPKPYTWYQRRGMSPALQTGAGVFRG